MSGRPRLTSSPESFSEIPEEKREALRGGAERESDFLTAGKSYEELEQVALRKEHDRTEIFRDRFNHVVVFILYMVVLILTLLASTWVYHIIAPRDAHWLDEVQIDKVQNLLTGGIVAGLGIDFIKKKLN